MHGFMLRFSLSCRLHIHSCFLSYCKKPHSFCCSCFNGSHTFPPALWWGWLWPLLTYLSRCERVCEFQASCWSRQHNACSALNFLTGHSYFKRHADSSKAWLCAAKVEITPHLMIKLCFILIDEAKSIFESAKYKTDLRKIATDCSHDSGWYDAVRISPGFCTAAGTRMSERTCQATRFKIQLRSCRQIYSNLIEELKMFRVRSWRRFASKKPGHDSIDCQWSQVSKRNSQQICSGLPLTHSSACTDRSAV